MDVVVPCPVETCGKALHVAARSPRWGSERHLIRTVVGSHLRAMHPALGVRVRSLLADSAVEAIAC